MRKTCLAVASLLLLILHSPVASGAEELPAPLVFVSSFLQLSEDQTRALITIIQTRDATLQPVAARLHTNHEALGKLLDSPAADAAAIGRLLIEIHADSKQLTAVAQDAAASFEEILSSEQRERLQIVRQAARIEPAIPPFKALGLL